MIKICTKNDLINENYECDIQINEAFCLKLICTLKNIWLLYFLLFL